MRVTNTAIFFIMLDASDILGDYCKAKMNTIEAKYFFIGCHYAQSLGLSGRREILSPSVKVTRSKGPGQ